MLAPYPIDLKMILHSLTGLQYLFLDFFYIFYHLSAMMHSLSGKMKYVFPEN